MTQLLPGSLVAYPTMDLTSCKLMKMCPPENGGGVGWNLTNEFHEQPWTQGCLCTLYKSVDTNGPLKMFKLQNGLNQQKTRERFIVIVRQLRTWKGLRSS